MSKQGTVIYTPVQIDYVAAIGHDAVKVGYEGRELWIPVSQIFESDVPTEASDEPCEINVASWLVKKEGMQL